MTISGSSQTGLLDSVLAAETAREQIGVAVLKKAQDSMRQQGEAAVQLLEQSGGVSESGQLDAYA